MNPVVFNLSRMNSNDFENSVDELQEFCTAVQLVLPVPVQIPEYNESILTLNAWRLPEGTACMVTAGSRNRYYPQPHLAQGSARESAPPESAWLWVLGTESSMGAAPIAESVPRTHSGYISEVVKILATHPQVQCTL